MRVDVNHLEYTADRMRRLSQQLSYICAQLNEAKAGLQYQMMDGAGVSESVLASLSGQIKELDQRANGAARMAEVLRLAAEEYRTCEQNSSGEAQTREAPVAWHVAVQRAVIAGLKEVVAAQEAAVYRHYIAPLINLGKRESE